MFGKILSPAILLLSLCLPAKAQIENKIPRKPILNNLSLSLPKPDYPQEAKDLCADGMVSVEVEIDEKGDVISAKAVAGDELLRESAAEAAKKAKFRVTNTGGMPIKVKGDVVYNFVPEKKCIEKGIVNGAALSLPKPEIGNIVHPEHLKISKSETVRVRVIIDVRSGEVTKARAISGHPLLRPACETAARQAKFRPFDHALPKVFVKAILAYKIKPDGAVETDFDESGSSQRIKKKVMTISCGQCNSKPILLLKPEYPKAGTAVGAAGAVSVEILIDENGNVESAEPLSGHPLLWAESTKAALKSKFAPAKLSGSSVKVRGTIVYNFVARH